MLRKFLTLVGRAEKVLNTRRTKRKRPWYSVHWLINKTTQSRTELRESRSGQLYAEHGSFAHDLYTRFVHFPSLFCFFLSFYLNFTGWRVVQFLQNPETWRHPWRVLGCRLHSTFLILRLDGGDQVWGSWGSWHRDQFLWPHQDAVVRVVDGILRAKPGKHVNAEARNTFAMTAGSAHCPNTNRNTVLSEANSDTMCACVRACVRACNYKKGLLGVTLILTDDRNNYGERLLKPLACMTFSAFLSLWVFYFFNFLFVWNTSLSSFRLSVRASTYLVVLVFQWVLSTEEAGNQ